MKLNNFIGTSLYSEALSFSVIRISRILWKRFYNALPAVLIESQFNLANAILTYSFHFTFNISFPSAPRYCKVLQDGPLILTF